MAKVRGGHQSRVRWGCLIPPPECPHGSELPLEGSSEEPSPRDSLSWAAVPRSAWLPAGMPRAGWTGSKPGGDGGAGKAGGEGSMSHARQKLPGALWTVWAGHPSLSSGRGRCQSSGGLCLGTHTRPCFRAARTLARSLSHRDRCKGDLVTGSPTHTRPHVQPSTHRDHSSSSYREHLSYRCTLLLGPRV